MAANDCSITLAAASTTLNLIVLSRSQADKGPSITTVTTIAASAGTTINVTSSLGILLTRGDMPGSGIPLDSLQARLDYPAKE